MPRRLFPLLALLLALAVIALAWLWWSDTLRTSQCDDAGGTWNETVHICDLGVTQYSAMPASPDR